MEVILQWMDELDDLLGGLALHWHRIRDLFLGLTTVLSLCLCAFLIL